MNNLEINATDESNPIRDDLNWKNLGFLNLEIIIQIAETAKKNDNVIGSPS